MESFEFQVVHTANVKKNSQLIHASFDCCNEWLMEQEAFHTCCIRLRFHKCDQVLA